MAFDLKAVLRLDDRFSGPMRRAQRATEQFNNAVRKAQRSTGLWRDANGRLRDEMGRFAKETQKASWNLTRLGNGLRNIAKEASGIRGLAGQFTALATAIGGAYAAKKVFDSTVWEAAKFENSQVVIRAMFDDRKAADQYMKMLQDFAVKSPVLNSQDMFENSKSFIATSKNLKQLEKMWNLAERLVALDPAQGVSGAVLALKEFFSGDIVSLVERFELPRKELKAIKDLPLDKQLAALDKFFNKLGATNKLVQEMGGTTIGLWNRVREQFQILLREMGRPSLEVLHNFLNQVIQKLESGDFSRFAQIGARMIKSILGGLTNGIISIYNWFDTITKSPEFQKRTTLWGKVQFVIGDLYQKFLEWLKDRGAKQIASATSDLILALSSALQQNAGPLTAAALTIGAQIGSAIAQGIMNAIASNPVARMVFGGAGTVAGIAKHYYDKFFGGKKSKKRSGSTSRNYRLFKERQLVRGYAGGINYVPYDGMPAILHRGEKVLPRGEADEYRRNKGRAGGVTINIANMQVRQESDIQKIAYELAKLIERKGASMANV
ncbi:hypothetical protein ETC04_16475 [Geobacillus sp. MR]|uniref:hypothetical protein n=1 Tax=Geobacillus sp. MR TaxID=2508875 RepID=UPI00148CFD27|nr:hypothetical protein [Geobacillus sp. MR]NNU88679.1 hypothetical protein [Geobacillus sp. MR]